MPKIKPCPYCGADRENGEIAVELDSYGPEPPRLAYVRCYACLMQGPAIGIEPEYARFLTPTEAMEAALTASGAVAISSWNHLPRKEDC